MLSNCPGSDKLKSPKPEAIKCGFCGEELEIWTDEVETKCAKCGNTVVRSQGQSCLDWCKFAKECVGEEAYRAYMENKSRCDKKKEGR